MAKLQTSELGKTGITVTRLSAGGHFTNGPNGHEDIPRRLREIHHMIDSGITYFDVQWDPEEAAMAEVMKTRANEIAVAWPLHGVTGLGGDVTADYVVDYCDEHRKRFGIEHVDVLLWIALEIDEETEEAAVGEVREGFERLKADGFCDRLGFSCHHSPEMALRAITRFDDFAVMMVPYCPLHPAAGRELLPAAKAKGIGTVGMKPFGGGEGPFNKIWTGEVDHPAISDWRGSGRPYQAAIRWVLQDENLDCTVPGMHSIEHIDEIVAASGGSFAGEDEAILAAAKAVMDDATTPVQLRGGSSTSSGAWD